MDRFAPHLRRWHLTPDGDPIATPRAALLPVIHDGGAAMLKIAASGEERRGGALLGYWEGEGAVRVLRQTGDAILLKRAEGTQSLAEMARRGYDDEATRIICKVAARLHAPRGPIPLEFVPLRRWFASLERAALQGGEIFAAGWHIADALLAAPQDRTALHGDLHHANVLDFGSHGWLAIDPKCVVGERAFDFAVMFGNPDRATAFAPGRFARQLEIIADAAGLDRSRLLRWTIAHSALGAAWHIEDGTDPSAALALAALAESELGR